LSWNKRAIDYGLYLVTDRKLLGSRNFLESLRLALSGGVTVVQLREKEVDAREFYQLAQAVLPITDSFQVPLIINDRLDICLAVGAAGVHLGQQDLPAQVARRLLGPGKLLGISTNNLEEARQAAEDGADYLGAGALFPTGTKQNTRSLTLERLAEIKSGTHIPVLGIGGVNSKNALDVLATGVDGICVASAILGRPNIQQAADNLKNLKKRW
jgi:thiamine-phosphate pyrophosphorylase